MAMLEINGLTKKFGGLTAVNDVSLAVEKGEISPSSARTAPARAPPSS